MSVYRSSVRGTIDITSLQGVNETPIRWKWTCESSLKHAMWTNEIILCIHAISWFAFSLWHRLQLKFCSKCVLNSRELGFPHGSAGKESACNARDLGLIPGLGRSPGEGKGYPFQYSGLENSMDCIVHGFAKSWIQLSDFHFTSQKLELWLVKLNPLKTNLDSILKSRDITLLTMVRLVKAMVFPVVMYGCEGWTIKKAECRRIDAFELWCWRRLLRVP